MRSQTRLIIITVMSMILTVIPWTGPAFGAGPSDSPDPGSMQIQEASSDTATVTLGKILTVNQKNRFPAVHDFLYRIERVEAWDNANQSTSLSGATIEKSQMPMPISSSVPHQSVTLSGDAATVRIGDFMDTSAANTPSTGDGADSDTSRSRVTPVKIQFAKAGYYVYKVQEIGSDPSNVQGMDYDTNEYFMVFYVCNKVDSDGNTVEGVYVHDITSYTNESGRSDYRPDLSDIQNVTDNNGTAAIPNQGRVNDDGTISHDLGKVGKSTSQTPNQLEAWRMWNAQTTHDLVLKKNVTGNLGDRTKEFEFSVTLSGLEPGQRYTTDQPAQHTDAVSTVKIRTITKGSLNTDGSEVTADSNGQATFTVLLKDDDAFVLNALPVTA